jgi:hypothetical protein
MRNLSVQLRPRCSMAPGQPHTQHHQLQHLQQQLAALLMLMVWWWSRNAEGAPPNRVHLSPPSLF